MKTIYYYSLCFVLALAACKGGTKPTTKAPAKRTFYNFIIAVDLSDRNLADKSRCAILPIKHDTSAIYAVLNIFKTQVLKNKFLGARDRIVIAPIPQPTAHGSEITDLAPEINMGAFHDYERFKVFDSLEIDFRKRVASLYNLATDENVMGSDMWRFFNDQLETQVIRDPLCTNVLLVLTDGYLYFDEGIKSQRQRVGNRLDYMDERQMEVLRTYQPTVTKDSISYDWRRYFDDNKYGLLEVHKNFGNLSVLVLGLILFSL